MRFFVGISTISTAVQDANAMSSDSDGLIDVELLPAYSPELNPEEYCHGNVKQGLKNARPTCKSEMRSMLDRGFASLRHRPDLLLSFFHRACLSVRKLRLM